MFVRKIRMYNVDEIDTFSQSYETYNYFFVITEKKL